MQIVPSSNRAEKCKSYNDVIVGDRTGVTCVTPLSSPLLFFLFCLSLCILFLPSSICLLTFRYFSVVFQLFFSLLLSFRYVLFSSFFLLLHFFLAFCCCFVCFFPLSLLSLSVSVSVSVFVCLSVCVPVCLSVSTPPSPIPPSLFSLSRSLFVLSPPFFLLFAMIRPARSTGS